jgi:hypothetical protein
MVSYSIKKRNFCYFLYFYFYLKKISTVFTSIMIYYRTKLSLYKVSFNSIRSNSFLQFTRLSKKKKFFFFSYRFILKKD